MRLSSLGSTAALALVAAVSSVPQATAEQDFHVVWCPQATSYYVQAREALDPLRAVTVAPALDRAKLQRQAAEPKGSGSKVAPAPVNREDAPGQSRYTREGNPLGPRHDGPPLRTSAPSAGGAATDAGVPATTPVKPGPDIEWSWDDGAVQDAVDQFETAAPLLFRRINTLVALTWWAELQDEGADLSAKLGSIVGDEREQVPAADLTADWTALEEQFDVIKNLCAGWGETQTPGGALPGQPEWPIGSHPPDGSPTGVPPAPVTSQDNRTATPGFERWDFRNGGNAQHGRDPDTGRVLPEFGGPSDEPDEQGDEPDDQ